MPTNSDKAKRFVELHDGKYVESNGFVATAKFPTEQEATAFMEDLEGKQVCCGPEMSDFTVVKFQENHLAEVLMN